MGALPRCGQMQGTRSANAANRYPSRLFISMPSIEATRAAARSRRRSGEQLPQRRLARQLRRPHPDRRPVLLRKCRGCSWPARLCLATRQPYEAAVASILDCPFFVPGPGKRTLGLLKATAGHFRFLPLWFVRGRRARPSAAQVVARPRSDACSRVRWIMASPPNACG